MGRLLPLMLAACISVVKVEAECVCETQGKYSMCEDNNNDQCKCKPGFESDEASKMHCEDINECTSKEHPHNCVDIASCKNMLGSYYCQCPQGFQGNGLKPTGEKPGNGCRDLNECETDDPCKEFGTCVNMVAKAKGDVRYICKCLPGYRTSTDSLHCIEQKCSFAPELPKLGLLGTCEQFLDKQGDSKIHLTAVTKATKKCEFHCNPGFARHNAEIECMPNNKDGSVSTDGNGEFVNTFTCVEQQCVVTEADLPKFGRFAQLGTCAVGRLNVLSGVRTCRLECMDGFKYKEGGVVHCDPNGDEPQGKLSGSITCEAAACPPLQNIKHGSSVSDTETEALGSVAILCDDGYNPVGGSKATCAPDSAGRAVWSKIPTCEPAPCEDLTVAYSDTSEEPGNVGDKVIVTCTGGATSTAKCVPDGNKILGKWIKVPSCEEEQKHALWLRVVVVASCISGFVLMLLVGAGVFFSCCLKK